MQNKFNEMKMSDYKTISLNQIRSDENPDKCSIECKGECSHPGDSMQGEQVVLHYRIIQLI